MTKPSYNSIARAIYLALKDKHGGERATIMHRAVDVLYRRRLLRKAGNILTELEKIANAEDGRIVAKVSSAKRLDNTTKSHLMESLRKRYQAQEVSLVEVVDEKLVSGFKVEVNNEVIDVSGRNKIHLLQTYLTR